jgi:hypothetical protein
MNISLILDKRKQKKRGGANNYLCRRLTRAAGSSILVGKLPELTALSQNALLIADR